MAQPSRFGKPQFTRSQLEDHMCTSATARSLLAGLVLTVAAAPLHAQRVEAGVAVYGGPVAGHVIVRDGYSTYHRPYARRVYVVERPRIVVVERSTATARPSTGRAAVPARHRLLPGRPLLRPLGRSQVRGPRGRSVGARRPVLPRRWPLRLRPALGPLTCPAPSGARSPRSRQPQKVEIRHPPGFPFIRSVAVHVNWLTATRRCHRTMK